MSYYCPPTTTAPYYPQLTHHTSNSISNDEGNYVSTFFKEPGVEVIKNFIAKGCGFDRLLDLDRLKCLVKVDISRCPWLQGEIDFSSLQNLTKVKIVKVRTKDDIYIYIFLEAT